MPTVLLGNTAPIEAPVGTTVAVNNEVVTAPDAIENTLGAKTIVLIDTPDHDIEGNAIPLDKRLTEVRTAFALHSSSQAAWVESSDDFFANAVAQTFDCQVGRPDDWDAPESAPEPVSAPVAAVAAQAIQDVQVAVQEA